MIGKRRYDQVVSALRLAAPFAIGARWDAYNHCVEVSTAGAIALERFGLKAEAVLCAVMFMSADFSGSMGLSVRQVYERIRWGDVPQEPFEEWCVKQTIPSIDKPIHCVIHSFRGTEPSLIDLTFGQIRPLHPTLSVAPAALVVNGDRWPDVCIGDWRFLYEESPYDEDYLRAEYEMMQRYVALSPGLVDDLCDLMDVALSVGCDYDSFTSALKLCADPTLIEQTEINLKKALYAQEDER